MVSKALRNNIGIYWFENHKKYSWYPDFSYFSRLPLFYCITTLFSYESSQDVAGSYGNVADGATEGEEMEQESPSGTLEHGNWLLEALLTWQNRVCGNAFWSVNCSHVAAI